LIENEIIDIAPTKIITARIHFLIPDTSEQVIKTRTARTMFVLPRDTNTAASIKPIPINPYKKYCLRFSDLIKNIAGPNAAIKYVENPKYPKVMDCARCVNPRLKFINPIIATTTAAITNTITSI